jgi:hypothetical protein
MVTTPTRPFQYNSNQAVLYLVCELGERRYWKLGFTMGFGQRPRVLLRRHFSGGLTKSLL